MRVKTLIGTVLVITGVVLAVSAAPTIVGREQAVAKYERVSEVADADQNEGGIDWDALRAQNPSVVAWCRLEGTSVDLPVCQATDEDPGWWLTHDLWGEESPAGVPYVDHRTGADARHAICYGHHLSVTGGMFSEIYRCYDQTEFDRILTGDLLWSTPMGGTVRLRPLCAMRRDMSYEQIQRFDFEDDGTLREWLETIIADSTAKVSGDEGLVARASRAVSVVTCSSDLPGQRDRTILVFVA